MYSDRGQTLIELVIVIGIVVIVVTALVFSTIFSIRNATFSKNQSQATKLAQEGLEKVRTGRDRGDQILGDFTLPGGVVDDWKDNALWSSSINSEKTYPCYFKLETGSQILHYLTCNSSIPSSQVESINNGEFKRWIILSDSGSSCTTSSGSSVACYTVEKTATVVVTWTDPTGSHEAKVATILRKL